MGIKYKNILFKCIKVKAKTQQKVQIYGKKKNN